MERFVKVGLFDVIKFCFSLEKEEDAIAVRRRMVNRFNTTIVYSKNGKFVYKIVTKRWFKWYERRRLNKFI